MQILSRKENLFVAVAAGAASYFWASRDLKKAAMVAGATALANVIAVYIFAQVPAASIGGLAA